MAKRNTKKRVTKKDIYKNHGIKFNGSQILTPFGNWIAPLLVDGNTKVGKEAKTWSIMHGNETYTIDSFESEDIKEVFEITGFDSVCGSCPCHCDGCYCDSGNFTRYSTTYRSNLFKLILVKAYPEFVKNAIIAQIEADKIEQVRIHASGDFFSVEYCDIWVEIVTTCKQVTFWTYTKVEFALKKFDGIDNLKIVPSITPYGINFGSCEQLVKQYNALVNMGYRVHICACGTEYEKHCSECKTGCKAIGNKCDFVLFIKHSTRDYDFRKDNTEYKEMILEIIRNQDN